jgi:radical SAM protein with 4Fe4S-binding SPASM domain
MIQYTKLKSTNRQDLMNVLPLPKPFTLYVEPSNYCNFKCIQCFQSIKADNYFTRNRINMPLERFLKVIQQLQAWKGPRLKVLKLSLYGEPLMNPDFCQMLRIARDADVAERIETTTNASLLTKAIAEEIVEGELDYIRVSIYATDQSTHEEVTGSRIDIRAIHDNLRVLQETKKHHGSQRPFVSAKMLDTYGEANERFVKMYRDVADEVYIDKPHNWIKTGGVDFMKNYYGDGMKVAVDDFIQHSTQRVACPMAFTSMAVRSNGDASPCCVDFIGGTNLDNIDKHGIREIWHSSGWFEFQKMQLQNRKNENYSCARCNIYLSNHYIIDNIDGFDTGKLLGASSDLSMENT